MGQLWTWARQHRGGCAFAWSFLNHSVNNSESVDNSCTAFVCTSSKQVAVWRGPTKHKKARQPSLEEDKQERFRSATLLVNIALSWTQVNGGLCQRVQSAPVRKQDTIVEQAKTSLVNNFDARYLNNVLRVWRLWQAWCTKNECSDAAPWEGAEAEFMHTPVALGKRQPNKVARTAPLTRWIAIRWLENNLGPAPVRVLDCHKPRRAGANDAEIQEETAAQALEPEILVQVDSLLPRLEVEVSDNGLFRAAVYFIWLAMITLRFQHGQRSVLVALTTHTLVGVCLRGKGQPGFFWFSPRYSPLGFDVGGRIWAWWNEGRRDDRILHFVMIHPTGEAWSMKEFLQASRHILHRWIGLDAESVALFTTYSLRRLMTTLGGVLKVHRLEALATGNWANAPSDMPARYAGEKSDAAKTVKLTYLYVIRSALRDDVRPMNWQAVRAYASSGMVHDARQEALVSLASDKELHTTPQPLLQGLVAPRRRFKLKGLKIRKLSVPSKIDGGKEKVQLPIVQADPGSLRDERLMWKATMRKGEVLVHILDNDLPYCNRRQKKARPFKKWMAEGDTVGGLALMHWSMHEKCERCWINLDAILRERLAAALQRPS